jgi:hypothetical protein
MAHRCSSLIGGAPTSTCWLIEMPSGMPRNSSGSSIEGRGRLVGRTEDDDRDHSACNLVLVGEGTVAGDEHVELPVDHVKECSVGKLVEACAMSGLDVKFGQPPTQATWNAGIEPKSAFTVTRRPVMQGSPTSPSAEVVTRGAGSW